MYRNNNYTLNVTIIFNVTYCYNAQCVSSNNIAVERKSQLD